MGRPGSAGHWWKATTFAPQVSGPWPGSAWRRTDDGAGLAHLALASLAVFDGRADEVEHHAAEVTAIAQRHPRDAGSVQLLAGVAFALAAVGRLEAARGSAKRLVDIAEELDSPLGRLSARAALGYVLEEAGEHDALPLLEAGTYGTGIVGGATAWNGMARARAAVGEPGRLRGFQDALLRHRQAGDQLGLLDAID
jgi:hypothetical protein